MSQILYVIILTLLLSACGDKTSIQTGEVGKVLGTGGLEPKIIQPGTFRMDWCGWGSACPKLVRLQVSKSVEEIVIDSLYLPASNVDIRNVQIGLQFQVKNDKDAINTIYAEVRPEKADEDSTETTRVMLISAKTVYDTYIRRKAPDAIVKALRAYTVEQVLAGSSGTSEAGGSEISISEFTKNTINDMLKDTPVEITEVGFPNGIGEVPEEVIKAKRMLYAIEEDRARRIKALEAELVIEDQRQLVQRKRVTNDLINAATARVPYEVYVSLKTYERFADASENGTPVALGTSLMPSMQAQSKDKD